MMATEQGRETALASAELAMELGKHAQDRSDHSLAAYHYAQASAFYREIGWTIMSDVALHYVRIMADPSLQHQVRAKRYIPLPPVNVSGLVD